MKKFLVTLVTLTALLLASFVFVGATSADENAEHICLYSGLLAFPGEIISITITDVGGNVVYSDTLDNSGGSDFVFTDAYLAYVPAVSGVITIGYTGPYGTGSYQVAANLAGNGECFGDGRINSRPDRDLYAPVAIYARTSDYDGYDAIEVYDINQVAGTGELVISASLEELEAAWDEALSSGGNVTVAQVGDIILSVLSSSTSSRAVCQVNAVEARENKPYVFRWVCVA